jgi:hypothetical protein
MMEAQPMDDPFEQALAIIREKGSDIRQADLREIEALFPLMRPDLPGWVYEGLSLIVNDPGYEGDIPPIT